MWKPIENRDRAITVGALGAVCALAWLYTLRGAGMGMSAVDMTAMLLRMPDMAMESPVWSASYAALMFVMWSLMMVAMMLPSAVPATLLFAALASRDRPAAARRASTGLFVAGYIAVWSGFSALATALQWLMHSIGQLTPMMQVAWPIVGGTALLLAGLYQFTPLKQACLAHCRSPLTLFARHWRRDVRGAAALGTGLGVYCVGCCWALMLLLFVGGVMNLLWIAALAVYVALEKLLPRATWLSMVAGTLLIVWGGLIIGARL